MNVNRKVYVCRNIVSGTIAPDHFLKRKEGGTKLGNLLRGVAKQQSGGILGNGALLKKALPKTDYKTPIAETIAKSTDKSIKESVMRLTNEAKEQLLNGQMEASSLPKTKQIRDAEKVAEKIYENPSSENKPAINDSGMKFNPMLIGGSIVGVIVLLAIIKKVA